MSPKYWRQNRNVCDLVLIFSQNQRLFFLKLNYTEVLHSSCYGLYRDKTKLFLISGEISRPHGARLLTSFESRQYSAIHNISSTRTFKYNIQWWEILPYSDKEITPKTFVKFRLQPQKKNRVSFTYRGRSTQKYHVCCMTRQYLLRIHFFASQRLSGGPAYLYNYIYLLLSSFFFSQIQVFRRSLSLLIKIIHDHVLRDKRKEPAMFWSANFPRLPRQFTYILNNFRLSKQEERMNKNKPKRNSCVDQKSAEIKLTTLLCWKATLPARLFHLIRTWQFDQ